MDEEYGIDPINEISAGKFEGQIFLSTDGKMTVSVKAEGIRNLTEAKSWAVREYNSLKMMYGTKQAQAVREYQEKPTNGIMNTAEICQHKETVEKTSHTPKNMGRVFKSCLKCNQFIGWVHTPGFNQA